MSTDPRVVKVLRRFLRDYLAAQFAEIARLTAELEEARKDAVSTAEPLCPACNGAGSVRAMTSHLGPDDYEYDEECAACNGTGSPDLKDAIACVGYIQHPQFPARLYLNREEVMKIVEARAAMTKEKP